MKNGVGIYNGNCYTIYIKIISVSKCYTQKNWAVTFGEWFFSSRNYLYISTVLQNSSGKTDFFATVIGNNIGNKCVWKNDQCKSWNCFTNKTIILKLILESTFISTLSHQLNIISKVLVQIESKGSKIRGHKWNIAII